MDKLKQPLDEKMDNIILGIQREGSGAFTYSEIKEVAHKAFSEGYNTRIVEENTPAPGNPKYDLKKVLEECRKLIVDGRPIAALRLYKETMGSSLTEAKAVLNL